MDQGHGALLFSLSFDTNDFEWAETSRQTGAGHDPDFGRCLLERFASTRSSFSLHIEQNIIADHIQALRRRGPTDGWVKPTTANWGRGAWQAPDTTALYIGWTIG
jgi:hypothetical protein